MSGRMRDCKWFVGNVSMWSVRVGVSGHQMELYENTPPDPRLVRKNFIISEIR